MDKLLWPIDKLHNWDKNPRDIKKEDLERGVWQLKRCKEITGEYLFEPLMITPEGTILGGNMRLKALKELGVKDIWVSIVNPKTEAEKLELALAANDRWGYYLDTMLAEQIQEYGTEINLENYKVDLEEAITLLDVLNTVNPKEIIEDEAPEVDEEHEPKSKLGERYKLGRHRLVCGDSTKIEDVEKLMNGRKADMVFTDPPYGVDYEGKTADKLKIDNDHNNDAWKNTVANFSVAVKSGASFYVCCPPGNKLKEFVIPFEEVCYMASMLIWVKNTLIMGHSDYQYQHEPIIYGWLKGGSHKFYGDRTQTTVWNIDKPSKSLNHPTTKPIALITKAINNSSKGEDIVLDLFGGSGSTLIACEQLQRTCYMMELDPKYCDVIRKRYAKFIGKEDQWEEVTKP